MYKLKTILLTLLAFSSCCHVFAQTDYDDDDFASGVFVKTVNGKDSVFSGCRLYKSGTKYDKQHKVIYKDSAGNVKVLTPNDGVKAYYLMHDKKYVTVEYIREDGQKEKIFAIRTAYGDSICPSLYRIYTSPSKYEMYMETPGNPLVLISRADDPSYGNRLADYLQDLNTRNGGNAEIAEYVSKVSSSRYSVLHRMMAIKSQNPNILPVFQWGVGTGVNINMPAIDGYSYKFKMSSQAQWQAHIFANYRTMFGVGIHTGLSFMKAACRLRDAEVIPDNSSNSRITLFATYSKTALTLPFLVRYTFTGIRGKWLPFVEGGVQLRYDFKDKYDRYILRDEHTDDYSFQHESYDSSAFSVSAGAGAGIEYRLTPKHSIFLEGRYMHQLGSGAADGKLAMPVNMLTFNVSFSL